MEEELLKTGEFAYLCGTTKETLRHYKNIGLLCPVAYAENGYALYSPLQLSDYLLIASLQHAGCSLLEIKGYLEDPDAEELDRVIADRIAAIAHERKVLLQQKVLLENTLVRMRARHDWIHNPAPYKLEVCNTEYFIDSGMLHACSSLDTLAHEQAVSFVRHILDTWGQGKNQGKVSELQGNYRVGLDAFLSEKPQEDFHVCTRTHVRHRRTDTCDDNQANRHKRVQHNDGELIKKPAGTYFKYLRVLNLEDAVHKDDALDEIFATYRSMKELLFREGFTPISDVFERELSLYTGKSDDLIYSELSVRVL